MISKSLVKLIRGLELKKNRKREGMFVAEGPKVVEEMIKHFTPHTIVCTPDYELKSRSFLSKHPNLPIHYASDEELRKTSFLQHPQQVIGVFHIPTNAIPLSHQAEKGLVIALDGVQDPGNLGTIIRIADWFGIDNIVCSPDTADVYNPKVVQATMGSMARVNVVYTNLSDYLDSLPSSVPVYGTLLDGEDIYSKTLTTNGVIIMGNEGNGISPEIRTKIAHRLLIPNFREGDGAESLNVAIATAIICSEFKRR